MTWITCCALTIIILEGMSFLLFPNQIKDMMHEADPQMLMAAGMIYSLSGATLLYIYLAFG
jgi:uncharacterized protein YjeT (DUF2065 family)